MREFAVKEYIAAAGRCYFREWLDGLSVPIKARVQARIFRFESGNLGDCKTL